MRVTQKEKEQLLAEKQVRRAACLHQSPVLTKEDRVGASVWSPEDHFTGPCPFCTNIKMILSTSIILLSSIKKYKEVVSVPGGRNPLVF